MKKKNSMSRQHKRQNSKSVMKSSMLAKSALYRLANEVKHHSSPVYGCDGGHYVLYVCVFVYNCTLLTHIRIQHDQKRRNPRLLLTLTVMPNHCGEDIYIYIYIYIYLDKQHICHIILYTGRTACFLCI